MLILCAVDTEITVTAVVIPDMLVIRFEITIPIILLEQYFGSF